MGDAALTHPTSAAARRANQFELSEVVGAYVKPPAQKYSASVFRKIVVLSVHPAPSTRGASRTSRTLAAGCDGRIWRERRARAMRTVKSRCPDPPMLGSSSGRLPGATVARKPGAPRRPRISRNPLRRECRLCRLPCRCLRAQKCISLHAGSRVRPASGIPCALHLRRGNVSAKARAQRAARPRCRASAKSLPGPEICESFLKWLGNLEEILKELSDYEQITFCFYCVIRGSV